MFQVVNKVTGGKHRAPYRSSGGRRIILKALNIILLSVQNYIKLCSLHSI
jgi:hypothetical protein